MDSHGNIRTSIPPEELKVFISHRASVCGECHQELGTKALIFLAGERGALCPGTTNS